MSTQIFQKTKATRTALHEATMHLHQSLTESGFLAGIDKGLVGKVLTMESADASGIKVLNEFGATTKNTLSTMLAKGGVEKVEIEGYTDAQWRAAAIVQAAAGDLGKYHNEAMNVSMPQGGSGISVLEYSIGANGFSGMRKPYLTMEGFDARELQAVLSYSTIFNLICARQSAGQELFFPTVTITPDQAGFEIVVSRTMVFDRIEHDVTGVPVDFARTNLINAIIDPTVLNDTSIAIVPIYLSGNATNNAQFATGYTPTETQVMGYTVETAPLKPGIQQDLLGISQSPALLATGILDQTDAVDQLVQLQNVYMTVVSTASPPITDKIQLPTLYLPRTVWQKSQEGLDREVNLTFITVDIPLSGATKNVGGNTPGSLAWFTESGNTNYFVRLSFNVYGDGNLETGKFIVNPGQVKAASIWSYVNGQVTAVTDPTVLESFQASIASMVIDGYDLLAQRSNLNRRVQGKKVETVWQSERRMIPLNPPITCVSPLTPTRTQTDVSGPITAARIRNDNLAITKLFAYDAMLSSQFLSPNYTAPRPNIEGIGGILITPFYNVENIDALKIVNSLTNLDRAEAFATALVNKLRTNLYKGLMVSGYMPALDAHTGYTGAKPTVAIITDPEIHQHLIVAGDTRLASIGYDYQVEPVWDNRMIGVLFMTLVRPGLNVPDPLNFGNMAWMPELATNLVVTRNGAPVNEIMVQPRVLHVCTLPWLVRFNISNVAQAVSDRIGLPFQSVTNIDTNTNTD